MNPAFLKRFAIVAAGGAIGAVIGAKVGEIIAIKVLEAEEAKYEEEARRWDEEHKDDLELTEEDEQQVAEYVETKKKTEETNNSIVSKDQARTDYTSIVKEYGATPILRQNPDLAEVSRKLLAKEDAGTVGDPGTKRELPFVISVEEWTENGAYDQRRLVYYALDDTLSDDQDNIVPNRTDILGPDAVEKFGTLSRDPDTVYIRNRNEGIDYEVTRLHQSYQETVMGILPEEVAEEEAKKPRRLKKGRKANAEE